MFFSISQRPGADALMPATDMLTEVLSCDTTWNQAKSFKPIDWDRFVHHLLGIKLTAY